MTSTARCLSWAHVSLCWPRSNQHRAYALLSKHLPRPRRVLLPEHVSRNHVRCQQRTDGTGTPHNLCDATVVLGGGLTHVGGIPAWGQKRLQTALSVYRQAYREGPVLCLGGGTPHKPAILSDTGHVIHEGSAYASYLLKHGVPAKHLFKEVSSYDTVGNAYFCLVIHALPAGWRLQAALCVWMCALKDLSLWDFRRIAVVTSDFHMPRTEAIFRHCSKLAGAWKGDKDWFDLTFHSASDAGIFPSDILQARQEREAESLQTWHSNAQRLKTLQHLHAFLHQEHACYSVAHQAAFGQPELDDVSGQALASY